MPYVINKTSGEPLLSLEDSILDTSTSVGLVGRNYVGYGETQNENFLHLMENFANTSPPSRPIKGQNWYDTVNNILKIYDGTNWLVVGSASISETPPETPAPGSIWLKLSSKVLYVYDDGTWQLIGPEAAEGFGRTRARSTVLTDVEGNNHPAILITVNDAVISIVSQREFFISQNLNPVTGFFKVSPGITLNSSLKIYGNLEGVASRATRLETIRNINGIGFNGETDIIIRSSTTRPLKRGLHLLGGDFDGSTEVTLSVDATPSNNIGKVVSRDSSGNFAAGTITANVVGTLQGNVASSLGTSSFDIVTANQFIGASLSGNANTASRLQFDRKINGVTFNGTTDVTITSSAETLSGTRLNSTVIDSNLNKVGTLVSLNVADLGINIGAGGQLRATIQNQIPTLTTAGTNVPLRVRIADSTAPLNSAGVDIIPASTSLSASGDNVTSVIPSTLINLGHPSFIFNKVYSTSFIGNLIGQANTSLASTSSSNISGGAAGSIPYQSAPGQTTFLPAGLSGQVLKSGGTGELTWGSISFTPLEIGEYLTGANYNGSNSTKWNVDATPNSVAGKVVARDTSGNFSAGTITANLTGNVTGNIFGNATTATQLQTSRTINGVEFNGSSNITIQATDPTKILKTGDTMTGQLSLSLSPTQAAHATNKAYVDSRLPQFTFIAGNTVFSTSGFTNIVNSFSNSANYFDVFPPSGKTMGNLVAFIPSIAIIHFAGGVNADDSMRCVWSNLGDRIRVYVQNTEQRSTPAANYLAIWS
jgi:fluoride ion exporter CrcB/FEX